MLRARLKRVQNAQAILHGLDDSLCSAGLMTVDEWRLARAGTYSANQARYATTPDPTGQRYHCNTKVMLTELVWSAHNAVPVRDELQAPLSWAITRGISRARYSDAVTTARLSYLPVELCNEQSQDTTQDTASQTMTVREGRGPLIISVICTTIGLAIFALTELRRFRRLAYLRANPTHDPAELRRRVLLEPPLVHERLWFSLFGDSKGGRAENQIEAEAARPHSTAYHDDDLQVWWRASCSVATVDMSRARAHAPSHLPPVIAVSSCPSKRSPGSRLDALTATTGTASATAHAASHRAAHAGIGRAARGGGALPGRCADATAADSESGQAGRDRGAPERDLCAGARAAAGGTASRSFRVARFARLEAL